MLTNNKQLVERAREAVTVLRDAVRVGAIIPFRQRDPLVLAIHAALDALEREPKTRPPSAW